LSDVESKDINLIFMARMVEKYIGPEALTTLLEMKYKKIKEHWREIGAAREVADLQYLSRLFTEEVHEYKVITESSDCLEVIVKSCKHAEIFSSYGAQDLGERMICAGDFAVVEGYNPKINLKRPTTCMTGECCHFKFRLN